MTAKSGLQLRCDERKSLNAKMSCALGRTLPRPQTTQPDGAQPSLSGTDEPRRNHSFNRLGHPPYGVVEIIELSFGEQFEMDLQIGILDAVHPVVKGLCNGVCRAGHTANFKPCEVVLRPASSDRVDLWAA